MYLKNCIMYKERCPFSLSPSKEGELWNWSCVFIHLSVHQLQFLRNNCRNLFLLYTSIKYGSENDACPFEILIQSVRTDTLDILSDITFPILYYVAAVLRSAPKFALIYMDIQQ